MRKIVVFLLFSAFVCSIWSCRENETTPKNELNIRLKKEPERINPLLFPNPQAREVYQYIFLPLADFNPQSLALEPILIKSLPEPKIVASGPKKGQISYTFEIIDKATWDDKKPITGQDYVFTLKAIMHPETKTTAYKEYVEHISDVALDSTNNKIITVYFDSPYFLAKEAAINLQVYPKHVYDPKGLLDKYDYASIRNKEKATAIAKADTLFSAFATDFNSAKYSRTVISGCGPYAFDSWNTNQSIVLKKKANYWAGNTNSWFAQGPERIIFYIIPDEKAAISKVQTGEIDLMNEVSSASFDQLKAGKESGKYNFFTPQLTKSYYLVLNTKDPRLQGKKTRQAIEHLVDINAFISNIEKGLGKRVIGPFNSFKTYYDNDIQGRQFDVEKAKTLLKEDGWADKDNDGILEKTINGKNTPLHLPLLASGDLGKKLGLIMQDAGKKVGVDLEVITKEFAQIKKENLEKGDFTIVPAVASHDLSNDDPSLRYHSDNAKLGGGNYSQFKNKEADALINKIISVNDETARKKAYQDFQKLVYEESPYIFLYEPQERIIVNKRWNAQASIKRPGYFANTFTLAKEGVSQKK